MTTGSGHTERERKRQTMILMFTLLGAALDLDEQAAEAILNVGPLAELVAAAPDATITVPVCTVLELVGLNLALTAWINDREPHYHGGVDIWRAELVELIAAAVRGEMDA